MTSASNPVEDIEHGSFDCIRALDVEEVPCILQHAMLALWHGFDKGSVCRELDLVEGMRFPYAHF